MNKFLLKFFLINLICLIFLLVDRYGKWLSFTKWATQKIELSFFDLTFLPNYNLIWNFVLPSLYIYILGGLAILVIITYLIQSYEQKNSWLILFLSLVLFGAFSNVADRIVYGYVIDYIDVSWWSVFNVADVGIVMGLFGWMILIVMQSVKRKVQNNSSKVKNIE